MNKTELFIRLDNYENEVLRFDDTYLAASTYGLFLGLEFQMDVSDIFSVGDIITIDKANKSINPWADGTQSIIGITASSIYPAPGSLVFTDRPLQLPISFTSNENGVIYQGTTISSAWSQVDLSDDVAFPITFNIADVREINNRNGAYSKTIVIPGTKENNKVFKYIFDIQGIDNYDTRVRVRANVVVDTIPVLEGYFQLDTINCDNNEYWSYNCIIYGENANFSKNIDQNALLNSLNFNEYDHYKTLDAITQSWVGDYTYGYYYPWVDYNSGKDPLTLQPITGSLNITNASLLSITNENFKPAIYVKQYWDKIFKLYGYTYESNFLNSDAFTSLIIPTNVKVLQNQDLWRLNSSMKAGISVDTQFINPAPGFNNYPLFSTQLSNNDTITNTWTMSVADPFFYNPQGVFYDIPGGSFRYQNTFDGTTFKNQKIILNLDYKITPTFTPILLPGLGFVLFYKFYRNGTYIATRKVQSFDSGVNTAVGAGFQQRVLAINTFGELEAASQNAFKRRQMRVVYDTAVDGNLNNGDTLEVRLGIAVFPTGMDGDFATVLSRLANFWGTAYTIDFYSSTNGSDGCYFYNDIDTKLLPNQPFAMSSTIPGNIKQIDFVNSIIKMFNLYLNQDKVDPKKIYIEPRDQFYETNFVDWSRKLDISKDILQKPIVDRKKRVFMSYKDDKDLINTFYKSNTNQIYGQYEYLTGNEFDTSEQKIEVIFSPSPLSNRKNSRGDLQTDLIYTQILDPKGTINTENYNIVDSNIRILYRKNISLTGTNFRIFDYQSYYSYETYPYAGHLDNPLSPGLDLSFSEPLDFFYINYFGYTNNNLYTLYYEQFFEEVYGLESKHIVAYVYLTPQDIIDFDYRKLVYLDSASSGTGGYFRVNKIEYDPFNKQSYKVELIKVLNNFKSKYSKQLVLSSTTTGVGVALPNWGTGLVTSENYNSGGGNIISGLDNSVRSNLNIVGGRCNQVLVGGSNIVTGYKNNTIAENSGIISGGKTTIYGTGRYSNVIGGLSQSLSGQYSSIIGGCNNRIDTYSSNNQILGGCNNRVGYNITGTTSVSQTTNSLILGGINNKIEVGPTPSATDNVFILGGQNNTIAGGVKNSFILGGENFTATQSNTIYLQGNVVVNGIDITSGIGGSGSTPITLDEIAFGTGTGITSSSFFKFTPGRSTLLGNSGLTDTSAGSIAASTKTSSIDGSYNTMLSSVNSSIYSNYNSIISACSTIISTGTKNSSILGGCYNNINGTASKSVILGGQANSISDAESSSIINSFNSQLRCFSIQSSIIGGVANIISYYAPNSTILGGCYNVIKCTVNGNSIIGGCYNGIYNNSVSSSIIGGCFNKIDTSVCNSGIVGGYNNQLNVGVYNSGIVGGIANRICNNSYNSTIFGGNNNALSSNNSTIVGGQSNTLSLSNYSSTIGGFKNEISNCSIYATIIGGSYNQVNSYSGTAVILGGSFNSATGSVSSIVSGQFSTISSSPLSSIIGGCANMACFSNASSIIGGYNNELYFSSKSLISGGCNNKLFNSCYSSVVVGNNNTICDSLNSTIMGGSFNYLRQSVYSSIIGGKSHIICSVSQFSSIIGGCDNTLSCNSCFSSIIGGYGNTLSLKSSNSSILGGKTNTIIGTSSFASIVGGCSNTLSCYSYGSSIVGGSNNNLSFYSTYASIVGGDNNILNNTSNSSIIGGGDNKLLSISNFSSIINSSKSIIATASSFSSIISGCCNILYCNSNWSSIVGGYCNKLDQSALSSIFAGNKNTICLGQNSVITGGNYNYLCNSYSSSILGGKSNIVCGSSCVSSIVAGEQNLMSGSVQSSMIGGGGNKMYASDQSSIIGGAGASMSSSPNSVILGGSGLTLSGESGVVLVPNLKVNDDITLTNVSGQATISATNSVVVSNTYIKVGSKILLSGDSNVTLWTSNLVANTSFKINSSSTGNYTIFYLIIN
jgi:hypothetical protein